MLTGLARSTDVTTSRLLYSPSKNETCHRHRRDAARRRLPGTCLGANSSHGSGCGAAKRRQVTGATRLVTAAAPCPAVNTGPAPCAQHFVSAAGHELINTVEVGAFKENKHNKRRIKAARVPF